MRRITVREKGLAGELFLPREGSLPLVITLGGFRGGFNPARAERLAASGFASLSLAYFGCSGLPSALREIPLEYFERAVNWAAQHPSVDRSRIALWGVSRGAELSLLLGSIMPDKIRAIAATVPSSAVYGSFHSDAPAWTYRSQTLAPNAPFPPLRIDPPQGSGPKSALALTPLFFEGMKDEAAFAASQIPVEKIRCPLLLVSGDDDQMWPSFFFARQIEKRLKMKGSPIPCTHLSYPGAGHAMSSSDDVAELHPIVNIWFALGGNLRDNALAMADSWEKTLHFFRSCV